MGLVVDPFLYTLFIGAVALLVLTPGPIVSLIIAETLSESPRHGIAVVLGAETVGIIMLALYLAGFSAIVGFLSDDVLRIVRYAGAAYLIYMAVQNFRKKPGNDDPDAVTIARTPMMAYKAALGIAATNPKAILFFAAFFPQFISHDLPVMPQLIALAITFAIVAPLLDTCWVAAAHGARKFLQKRGSTTLISRISGSVLAFAAIALLLINK